MQKLEKEKQTIVESNQAETSSIGPTYPPQESSFGRIKGFEVRFVVDSDEKLKEIETMLESLVKNKMNSEITRVSYRFLCSRKVLRKSKKFLSKWGESVFSLGGSEDFDGLYVVYAGQNSKQRRSDNSDMKKSSNNIESALRRPRKKFKEIIKRVEDQGYSIESVSHTTRKIDSNFRSQMVSLYSRFGWSPEEVLDILENETNIIVVAKKNGQVVSAGLAERASVNVNIDGKTKELRIAELTEAATVSEHQGKGLYTAVAATLLSSLDKLKLDEKVHVAFGECNSLAAGVLKAARDLNRTFAYEDSNKMRLPVKGMLTQHVPIDGPERNTMYNDLYPSYITRKNIKRFVND